MIYNASIIIFNLFSRHYVKKCVRPLHTHTHTRQCEKKTQACRFSSQFFSWNHTLWSWARSHTQKMYALHFQIKIKIGIEVRLWKIIKYKNHREKNRLWWWRRIGVRKWWPIGSSRRAHTNNIKTKNDWLPATSLFGKKREKHATTAAKRLLAFESD